MEIMILNNLFATSEPPKYLNSPIFFLKFYILFVFLLNFLEAPSKEFLEMVQLIDLTIHPTFDQAKK